MRQLFAHLTENPHDIGKSRIPIGSTSADDGSPRQSQHPVEAAVLPDEVFHIKAAFVVVAHGSFLH
jgi:hypothetical protein